MLAEHSSSDSWPTLGGVIGDLRLLRRLRLRWGCSSSLWAMPPGAAGDAGERCWAQRLTVARAAMVITSSATGMHVCDDNRMKHEAMGSTSECPRRKSSDTHLWTATLVDIRNVKTAGPIACHQALFLLSFSH